MRFFSLRHKILVFSAVAALILTILITSIEIHNALTSNRHSVVREMERFDSDFRKFLANKVWGMEYDSLAEFTASISHTPWLALIAIRDTAGNLIASSGVGASSNSIIKTLELTYHHNDKLINIGSVRLEGHMLTLPQVLKDRLSTILLINGALTIFIFICAYFFVHRTVLSRLQSITSLFIGEGANDDRKETERWDEIDLVTQQLHLRARQVAEELKRRRTAEAELERQNLQLKTEISKRIKIEQELRNNREWHVSILKTAMDGFLLVDLTGRILEVNQAYCRMTGYSEQELLIMNVADLDISIPNSDIVTRIDKITQLREDRFETIYRVKNGDFINVEISAQYNPVNEGRIIAFIQDITERKRAEEELRESEERNRQILHSSLDGFWRVDSQTRLIEVNDAYCRMSGYSREELLTMAAQDLEALETAEAVAARTKRIIKNGSDRFTTSHCRKDGRIFEVEASIQYRPSKDGGEFVVFLRDVTEKRYLESQLRQAQKLEAIGTLAGGIAHDFNNILGAIVGYSEMIRDDLAPESPSIHGINQVLKASHRAKDLVKQILAFSRQVEDQKIPAHPAVIVKEAITLLRSSLPVTITIEQDIDPDAGSVLADPTQLHQIVMNLCTNAFHAMEDTGGILEITLKDCVLSPKELQHQPAVQPGDFVNLSIADTGPGIPKEIQNRIFEPYFTTKEVGKGTGLGLSIVHGIISSLGGFITCESEHGKGTVFNIFIPATETEKIAAPKQNDVELSGKEHILLVDDEEILTEMGKAMLERLGYQVTTRSNSLDALETFQNQPQAFDAIVTDQTMPGMTGIDLSRRMLQIRPDVPIVLCTGYSSIVDEKRAYRYGIKGFVMKPLTKKDLASALRKAFDHEKSS